MSSRGNVGSCQVILAQSACIDEHFLIARFQVAELRESLEWKLQLLRGQNLQEHDFVVAMAKVLEGLDQRFELSKKSDRMNTMPAALQVMARQFVQSGAIAVSPPGFVFSSVVNTRSRCLGFALGGISAADFRVERDQSDGIHLMEHQVRERRGHVLGVLELAQRLPDPR